MYIDQGEVLRVRVEADEFCDDEPGPPRAAEGVAARREPTRPPYIVCVRLFVLLFLNVRGVHANRLVQCSIAEQGLGPVAWWNGTTQAEDGGDEMGEG